MDASAETIPADLLAWYDLHARSLPWRSPPGTPPPEPYRVWLSEVMLQQTTVVAVRDYFRRFVARWPTVEALADVSAADVIRAWQGLGYNRRALNLHRAARHVAANGWPEDLTELPGVGRYTADAVARFAYDLDVLPVDESFPSGHVAASLVVYVGLALLVSSVLRRRWVSGRNGRSTSCTPDGPASSCTTGCTSWTARS